VHRRRCLRVPSTYIHCPPRPSRGYRTMPTAGNPLCSPGPRRSATTTFIRESDQGSRRREDARGESDASSDLLFLLLPLAALLLDRCPDAIDAFYRRLFINAPLRPSFVPISVVSYLTPRPIPPIDTALTLLVIRYFYAALRSSPLRAPLLKITLERSEPKLRHASSRRVSESV